MPEYTYPTQLVMTEIERNLLPRLTQERPAFDILPPVNKNSFFLQYGQRADITGLQQVRGLDGEPKRVKELGGVIKSVEPGVYGEYRLLNERELTTRSDWFGGSMGTAIPVDDLVADAQTHLLQRRLDRMEQLIWNLLIYGTFSALDEVGAVLHTDIYSIQTQTFVAWSNAATATPLANLRAVQVLSRGTSVNFGATSVIFMNRVTANTFLANTNANDIGGKRQAGLASITSIGDVNRILTGEDLPAIQVYDKGYIDESNVFQLYIPNGRAIVVGRRESGVAVGEYQVVRNANNVGSAPGAYNKVIDKSKETVPPRIEIHHGHNGGPILWYPNAVVSLTV